MVRVDSRGCSGNEPALLPRRYGWTRVDSFVSLKQSDNRPQIFVGHKLSRQFGLRLVIASLRETDVLLRSRPDWRFSGRERRRTAAFAGYVTADDVELINGTRENFRDN